MYVSIIWSASFLIMWFYKSPRRYRTSSRCHSTFLFGWYMIGTDRCSPKCIILPLRWLPEPEVLWIFQVPLWRSWFICLPHLSADMWNNHNQIEPFLALLWPRSSGLALVTKSRFLRGWTLCLGRIVWTYPLTFIWRVCLLIHEIRTSQILSVLFCEVWQELS